MAEIFHSDKSLSMFLYFSFIITPRISLKRKTNIGRQMNSEKEKIDLGEKMKVKLRSNLFKKQMAHILGIRPLSPSS